jgi:hypothetical protein
MTRAALRRWICAGAFTAGNSSALLAGDRRDYRCGIAACMVRFGLRRKGQVVCQGDEVLRRSLEKGAGVLLGGCIGAMLRVAWC